MWVAIASDDEIQIVPSDEQYFHLWNVTCECCPISSVTEEGTVIIKHNSFDDREIFERASQTKLHTIRQKQPC